MKTKDKSVYNVCNQYSTVYVCHLVVLLLSLSSGVRLAMANVMSKISNLNAILVDSAQYFVFIIYTLHSI